MRQTKTGILLANLGTPDAPTPEAVKRYLKQFLSDRRVVDTSRLLWWPLLRGVILPLRSPRVAKLYASVWMEGGSPLMVYSRQQQQALAQRLPETPVALGMSYGSPSLESAVDELLAQSRWIILWCCRFIRNSPVRRSVRYGMNWHAFWRANAHSGDIVYSRLRRTSGLYPCAGGQRTRFFAVHGNRICCCSLIMGFPSVMPDEGDDYPQRCRTTTRELVSALGMPPERVMMTFQSLWPGTTG